MISPVKVATLLGYEPTPADLAEIHRIQSVLNARDDDAILLVFIALLSHQKTLTLAPSILKTQLAAFADSAARIATAKTAELAEQTTRDLAQAVAAASVTVANETAKKSRFIWTAAATTTLAVCFSLVGYFAHSTGITAGYFSGLLEARNEVAAANWANTADGRKALRLSKSPAWPMLTKCHGAGWQIKDGVCYPHPANGRVSGWPLP